MNNTLGSYIRFIPAIDQDTIAKCTSIRRQCDVHRGMLSFIPIDELIEAVRFFIPEGLPYNQYTLAMQQAVYQQQAILAGAQYNYPQTSAPGITTQYNYPQTPAPGITTNYPYQAPSYPSTNTAYPPYISQEGRAFAYAALLVARGMMLKDEDERETVQNEHDVSENVEENNSKII